MNDLKNINNYVCLSMTRSINTQGRESELIHVSAIRFINDKANEYIDVYVRNSKKNYNELNHEAKDPLFVLSSLKSWLGDDIILIHEGGRNDIDWLSEQIFTHFKANLNNSYIDLEFLAIKKIGLKKTSLKNIAKHFGVYRVNNNPKILRDIHACFLINEIWKAYKESL